MSIFPYLVAIWLLLIGIYGIVTSRHLVHLVICLIVAQSSTYVLLLAVGFRTAAQPPVTVDVVHPAVDPVVQALTLTDIVVEAAVAALLLGLTIQAQKRFHNVDPEELRPLRG